MVIILQKSERMNLLMSLPQKLRQAHQEILVQIWMVQAASILMADFVSQATGSQVDSALTHFYRLLHNSKLDDLKVTRQMLSFFVHLPRPFLVAIDWTEWHQPLHMRK